MIHAVLVAGGSGTRMNSSLPKQFLTINGKSILRYSVEAFLGAFSEINITVVLPAVYLEQGGEELNDLMKTHSISIVAGGETRFHSVKNGLNKLTGSGIVFIHDAVRPCITSQFLLDLSHNCITNGNAVPCIAVKDSLRKVIQDESAAVDRSQFKIVQTPQVFHIDEIKKAFELPYQSQFTDEATVLEAFGAKVHLCEGLEQNIKITTPDDLPIATHYLKSIIIP